MLFKPKNSFLIFFFLTLCHAALAEVSDSDGADSSLGAPTDIGTSADPGVSMEAVSRTIKVSKSLSVVYEQLESVSSENHELKDRLSEAESIIVDLTHLAALKEEELNLLLQQTTTSPTSQGFLDTEEAVKGNLPAK